MAWRVEVDTRAVKDIKGLPQKIATRILGHLMEVASCSDRRSTGKALKGREHGKRWCYRVGDYRIICSLSDEARVITVAQVGDRKEVYR